MERSSRQIDFVKIWTFRQSDTKETCSARHSACTNQVVTYLEAGLGLSLARFCLSLSQFIDHTSTCLWWNVHVKVCIGLDWPELFGTGHLRNQVYIHQWFICTRAWLFVFSLPVSVGISSLGHCQPQLPFQRDSTAVYRGSPEMSQVEHQKSVNAEQFYDNTFFSTMLLYHGA